MARRMIQRVMTATTIGAAVALLAGAAHADLSYSVKIAKSDFASTAKVAALHERIRRTAAKVCPSYFVSRSLAEVSQCRREVEADLVSRINHPVLTAYVRGEKVLQVAALEAPGDAG